MRALETFGEIFIPESEGFGAGVRLSFYAKMSGRLVVWKLKAELSRTISLICWGVYWSALR